MKMICVVDVVVVSDLNFAMSGRAWTRSATSYSSNKYCNTFKFTKCFGDNGGSKQHPSRDEKRPSEVNKTQMAGRAFFSF
jgi:hypothetical protein